MLRREIVEDLGQPGYAQRADVGGRGAVIVDEDERGLCRDLVVGPQRAVIVDGVLEGADIERVDELVNCRKLVPAGNTDKRDGASILLVYRCDRRGFCSARRSPRCPEPQHGVGAFEGVEVDLATRCRFADQRQRFVVRRSRARRRKQCNDEKEREACGSHQAHSRPPRIDYYGAS